MPCRAPLPPELATVLRWLRREHPVAARDLDLKWADDPDGAEADLRALLPLIRPDSGRVETV